MAVVATANNLVVQQAVAPWLVVVRHGIATATLWPYTPSSLAFDAQNQLWLADESSPEVSIYNPATGSSLTFLLTTAAPGTQAYLDAVPVSLAATGAGMVVQTQSGALLFVK
jgi:hypothetical protein